MTDKRYFALIGEDGYVYPVFFDSENEDKEIDVDIVVDLLNENEQLRHDATILIQSNQDYRKENEHYKSIFFELVETALTDKNCRELYCEGILDIFDKANSLNQAREMIKGHLK